MALPININDLNIPAVTESFLLLTIEQWEEAVRDYLSSEHKGASNR